MSITDKLSCTLVLNVMVILGFMLNYALRVNITLAIVAMVKPTTHITDIVPAVVNGTTAPFELPNFNGTRIDQNVTDFMNALKPDTDDDRFDWDKVQQGVIIGSFYWGYLLTELPGGRLAEMYGGRRIFGHSMFWASIVTFVTPFLAHFNYYAFIVGRVFLGLMLGASWPAIHPMASVWIKPNDRSKFMSNMMASSLGAAIAMPFCGYLISHFGWASAFYATGTIGLLWSIVWFLIIYETPAVHPRISPKERKEIEEAIGSTTSKNPPSFVPWVKILTSAPVWAIILTHGASVFGFFTISNQLPTFMNDILKVKIEKNGFMSAFPYLGKYVMAVSSSFLADGLRKRGTFSTTAIRKIFTAFAVLTPGLFMVVQVFVGQDEYWSIATFTIALTLNGAVVAGYLGNGLDIAPNFSGTIFGMANTLSSIGGFVSAWMVGVLTKDNQSWAQWQTIWWILAAIYIFGALAYLIMGSGELQKWNNAETIQEPKESDNEATFPLKVRNGSNNAE